MVDGNWYYYLIPVVLIIVYGISLTANTRRNTYYRGGRVAFMFIQIDPPLQKTQVQLSASQLDKYEVKTCLSLLNKYKKEEQQQKDTSVAENPDSKSVSSVEIDITRPKKPRKTSKVLDKMEWKEPFDVSSDFKNYAGGVLYPSSAHPNYAGQTYTSHEVDIASSDIDCAICFDVIKDSDLVREIPCKHIFHKNCIDTWLTSRAGDCPICRLSLAV